MSHAVEPIITDHAIERYQQRVEPVCAKTARARLADNQAIQTAVQFGATGVILPKGQRVIIKDAAIITIVPKRGAKHAG